MNQFFRNTGIAGVENRPINIMDTDARLSKVAEDKEKDGRIRDQAGTGAYPRNEHHLN